MTIDTIIIYHSNAGSSKTIASQVSEISDDIVTIEAGSTEELKQLCAEYNCSLLLIEADLNTQNQSISAQLPDDTVILILAHEEQIEDSIRDASSLSRNYSVVSASSPVLLLQHYVQTLLKQRDMSLELLRSRATIYELTEQLASKKQSLHTQQHYLDILAERDGLTGLYNRKQLSSILQREFQRAIELDTDLSLLIMDINGFKETNRKHGHLFGDFVLNEIAARLTSNTRDSDLCFRFSGGNFIILLPQSNITHARQAAKKLIRCCSEKPFNNGQTVEEVTISIGVSSLCDSKPETPEQLINMADCAMSQSKAEK